MVLAHPAAITLYTLVLIPVQVLVLHARIRRCVGRRDDVSVVVGINLQLILVLVQESVVLLVSVGDILVVSDQHVVLMASLVGLPVGVLVDGGIDGVAVGVAVVQIGVAQAGLRVDDGIVLGDGLVVVVDVLRGRRRLDGVGSGGVEVRGLFIVVVGVMG